VVADILLESKAALFLAITTNEVRQIELVDDKLAFGSQSTPPDFHPESKVIIKHATRQEGRGIFRL